MPVPSDTHLLSGSGGDRGRGERSRRRGLTSGFRGTSRASSLTQFWIRTRFTDASLAEPQSVTKNFLSACQRQVRTGAGGCGQVRIAATRCGQVRPGAGQ